MWITAFLLTVFSTNLLLGDVTYNTIPDTNNGRAYIFAEEGTLNVSIYCEVFIDDKQFQSRWLVKRQSDTVPIEPEFNVSGQVTGPLPLASTLIGKIIATGELIPNTSVASRTNFTIVNLTSEFHLSQVQCGPQGETLREFNFGFPVLPSLLTPVSTQSVIEGNNVTVNLTVGGAPTPFPPLLTSQWTYEGQPLLSNDSNDIILTNFIITLTNVQRNQSGNYTLTVSNNVGSTTTSFILDVQYVPTATRDGRSQLVLSGNTVTLIAFTDIEGNPVPNVTWTGPDNTLITPGDHFNTSVDGQITITNVINEDNGTYTCIVSNGIGSGLYQTVQLIIAVIPGPPLNVTEMDVTDTSVKLTWSPPNELGIPTVSYYHVVIVPPPPSDVILNTTNTTLIIRGIIPSTTYNVTVVAVAMGDTIGLLKSEPSDLITFITMRGAPMFQTVNAIPSNGNINISWIFRHTGGQDIDDIEVYCAIDEEDSSNQLYNMLSCSNLTGCVDDSLMGSTSVGPVFAGERYYCSITAINTDGTDMRNISDIIPTEGIPSIPELISTISSPGHVTLEVRTRSPGDNSTFQFNVTIINITDNSILQTESFSFMKYISNTIVPLTIVLTNGGSFSFNITTINRYGTSDAISTGKITVQPTTQTTTTSIITSTVGPSTTPTTTVVPSISITVSATPTTSPPTESRPSDLGLSGGAIAGIVIAIIIIIAIAVLIGLIIFYIFYKNKGDSYQVERGGGKGVTVEELDIDIGTELKGTSSGGGESQTEPPTEKPELHYADLEHFQKKPQQSGQQVPAPKPQPIQEVHYAEIKPQDATKTSST